MKTTIKDLEKRIEKLEKINQTFLDYLVKQQFITIDGDTPQPKYQVGDYVQFYDTERFKHNKGKIIDILCDGIYHVADGNFNYYAKDIIGYAKPDLLTQEEKEYLGKVIFGFTREPHTITIEILLNNIMYIKNFNKVILKIYLEGLDYKFDGLLKESTYTLSELGL